MDIRKARKASNLTQEQLAKLIGVNRATLSKYENGQIEPPPSKMRKLAQHLNVPVTALWGLPEKYEDELSNALSMVEAYHEGNLVLTDLSESDPVAETMINLVEAFYQLNLEGQKIAVERVKELSEIPKYKRTPTAERAEMPSESFADAEQGNTPQTKEKPPEGQIKPTDGEG